MAVTPEGKVKAEIKKILNSYSGIFYDMPVPYGYGKSTVDFLGWYKGRPFAIEAKANAGDEPTPLQADLLEQAQKAGAAVFVIAGKGATGPLQKWLETVSKGQETP